VFFRNIKAAFNRKFVGIATPTICGFNVSVGDCMSECNHEVLTQLFGADNTS